MDGHIKEKLSCMVMQITSAETLRSGDKVINLARFLAEYIYTKLIKNANIIINPLPPKEIGVMVVILDTHQKKIPKLGNAANNYHVPLPARLIKKAWRCSRRKTQ